MIRSKAQLKNTKWKSLLKKIVIITGLLLFYLVLSVASKNNKHISKDKYNNYSYRQYIYFLARRGNLGAQMSLMDPTKELDSMYWATQVEKKGILSNSTKIWLGYNYLWLSKDAKTKDLKEKNFENAFLAQKLKSI